MDYLKMAKTFLDDWDKHGHELTQQSIAASLIVIAEQLTEINRRQDALVEREEQEMDRRDRW